MERNISAPSGQRIVKEFEIKTNESQFSNITVSYNYTSVASSLDDETGLRMYKCSSQASCEWTLLATALNTTHNTISAVVNSLSVFLVSETATTTSTVTTTTTVTSSSGGGGGSSSGGGGGGSIVTRAASLSIILPSPIALGTNDSVKVPIIIKNIGEVKLNNITLGHELSAEGISISLENYFFESLGINETASTNAIIASSIADASAASIEAKITAGSITPKTSASATIIIEVIDIYKANKTEVEEKLKFALDLFEQNPECLELKELLGQAEKAAENKEFLKALRLAESAITACRQLVGKGIKVPAAKKPKAEIKLTLPMLIVILLLVLALLIYGASKIKWKKPGFKLKQFNFKYLFRKRKHKIGPSKGESKSFESEEQQIRQLLRRR